MFQPALIAADWLGWIVPAVFILIYVLNHLLSSGKPQQQRNQPQRRQQQPRRPEGERPLKPAQQQPAQSQLNSEIEQFLKRANERRMEKARREGGGRPGSAQSPDPPAPRREQPLDVEPMEPRDFDSIAASVEQHLGDRGFEQRAERLTDDIARQDQQREQHFQEAFNRRVGTFVDPGSLAANEQVQPETPTSKAAAMAGLLVDRQSIREAIILREILDRPVDRW